MATTYDQALQALLNYQGSPFTYQSYGPVSQDTGASSPIAQLDPKLAAQMDPQLVQWLNSYGSNVAYNQNPDGSANVQIKEPGGKTGTILNITPDGKTSIAQQGAPMNTNPDNSWLPKMAAMAAGANYAAGNFGNLGSQAGNMAAGEGGMLGNGLNSWTDLTASGAGLGGGGGAGAFGISGADNALANSYNIYGPSAAGSAVGSAAGNAAGSTAAKAAGTGVISQFLQDQLGLSPSTAGLLGALAPSLIGSLGGYFAQKSALDQAQAQNAPARNALQGILNTGGIKMPTLTPVSGKFYGKI